MDMQQWIEKILDYDYRLSQSLRLKTDSAALKKMASIFAHTGDSWFWLAGLVLLWLFGNPEWRYKAAILAISLVILAVFVLFLKFTIRRRRPEGDWGEIYRKTDPHSFPSGHAARAALLAVMAIGLGPAWFGLVVGIWAPFVSLARIVMGVHYVSDVVVGFIIGIIVGWVLLDLQGVIVLAAPFIF